MSRARRPESDTRRDASDARIPDSPGRMEWLERAALAAAIVALILAATRALWSTDLGWQLRTGELIAESGPPQVDVLSRAAAGRPWIELRWLWCLSIASLMRAFGPPGVVLFSLALHVGAFLLALATGRALRGRAGAAALVLLVATLAASQRLVARPEAISGLGFTLFVWLLDRDRRRPTAAVWALVPAQILWTNAHTLFVLGPGTALLAAAASGWWRAAAPAGANGRARLVRSLVLAGAVTLACLVNPYGPRVFAFAWTLASEIRDPLARATIAELHGPFAVRAGYLALPAYVALLVGSVLAGVAGRRRLDPFLALVWGFALALSLTSIRNIPLFALAALPFTLRALPDAPWRASGRRAAVACAALAFVASAALAWAIVTNRFFVVQHDTGQFGLGIALHRFPEAAAGRVRRLRRIDGATPRVFAGLHESSWLLRSGVSSWTDPRLEVFGATMLARSALATREPDVWESLERETDPDVVVAGLDDLSLLRMLSARPAWRLTSIDPEAAVFVREARIAGAEPLGAGDLDSVATRASAALPRPTPWDRLGWTGRAVSATPYHRFGAALNSLGRPDLGRPYLEDAVSAEPFSAPAHLALAVVLERLGERAAARSEREAALRVASDDADALSALALQDLEDGRIPEATARLERAVRRHPDHALAWALLGEAREMAGRHPEALDCLERAMRLAPGVAQYRNRYEALARRTR